MRTFYAYMRGGGGADCGAEQAGYTSIGGVEVMADIAAACDVNFPHAPTTVADVCAVDPATLLSAAPGWFHASPSCRNASVAKAQVEGVERETEEDRDAGRAVARFITHWLPPVFTLENVFQYRTFDAFNTILETLRECGYSYEFWHLNAASYGVPQTRKRLILIAKLGHWRIQRPEPTHRDGGDMFLPPWKGWYDSIRDLIPMLPESKFAAWQLARLPAEFIGSCLVHPTNMRGMPVCAADQPAFTVMAGSFDTSSAPSWKPRAFLMRSQNTQQAGGNQVRYEDTPAMTITAEERPRAFLVGDQYAQPQGTPDRQLQIAEQDDPAFTVRALSGGGSVPRAFLIGGANTSDGQAGPGVGVSEAHEPTRCVNASNSVHWRAWLSQGRVVSMSSRALARFQDVPDWYVLPAKASLACRIVGNMVPALLMQRIGESL